MKTAIPTRHPACARLRLRLTGTVQGVGFRPFVHRLATELALSGYTRNSPQGVVIEIEGLPESIEQFSDRLTNAPPPLSSIQECSTEWLDALGDTDFKILESIQTGIPSTIATPDLATCPDCLHELFDPADRRFRYPFTNCTHCGPRFSILDALPYDRARTTMNSFVMCPACQAEYQDPANRRFHAQPNACPACGPQLQFLAPTDPDTPHPPTGDAALRAAVLAIQAGHIIAVKGIGGFHLIASATNSTTLNLLRQRKHREEKPFAVLFPSIRQIETVCHLTPLEASLLSAREGPIVLLQRRHLDPSHPPIPLSDAIAPGNPCLGVFLPSNPLHHLLIADLACPVVATSGNLSDESICTDNLEALDRLQGIADGFLLHDRPIARPLDDSIVRIIHHQPVILRRARGYAPLPVPFASTAPVTNPGPILATGAHLKNTVALAVGGQAFVSQHGGDLGTLAATQAFHRACGDLPSLYLATPEIIATDPHPDYASTQFAEQLTRGQPTPWISTQPHTPALFPVQHHAAHVLSCVAENDVQLPALGVAWDGTGLGTDGTIWGGEFFTVTHPAIQRIASLRPFPLPGGEAAIREPRRAALGLLHALCHGSIPTGVSQPLTHAFRATERRCLETLLQRQVHSPITSSIGRLFDAVASLANLRQLASFEGQAAMDLEFATNGHPAKEYYPFPCIANPLPRNSATQPTVGPIQPPILLDWAPMIEAILHDIRNHVAVGTISIRFHNALAEAIVRVAQQANLPRIALSGGCFQNHYLLTRVIDRLRQAGFEPFWHCQVPTNDGGIALGQAFAARYGFTLTTHHVPRHSR